MSKKLISIMLAFVILISCFSVGLGSVVSQAREIGVGTGAESFNPVDFSLSQEVFIGTDVNLYLNAEITNNKYKVAINYISAFLPYYTEGGISYLDVEYNEGTIVSGTSSFAVTGKINADANSIVRYTISYDILDIKGVAVWKNLTGYVYGLVSGSAAKTGAVGVYHAYPGQLSDGCYFESLDTLNTIYVQQSELMLNYKIRTQSAWNYEDPRTRGVNIISGNAPSTTDTMPDNNGAARGGQMDWPRCGPVYRSNSARWLSITEYASGYYNFTVSFNSWNDDWEDQSNITETTEMYYISDADKVAAYNAVNKIVRTRNAFSDGYYVQKGLYTEESWDNLVNALDIAYQVSLSVPNANYGYKVACQNAAEASANVDDAFASLESAEHDFYTYKDPVTVNSTCTEAGYELLTCICGEEKTNEIPALGHDQGEWMIRKEATCAETGVEALVCTRCKEDIKTRDIPLVAHSYQATVVPPTCTENGYTINQCTVCSDSYENNFVATSGHSYVVTVVEPTCTENGYTTYTCSVCDYSLNILPTSAKGHQAGEAVVENEIAVTCTTDGSYDTVVYCTTCDEEISRETTTISASGHVEGEWTVTKEPTAAESGEETLCCSVCNEVLDTREIVYFVAKFEAEQDTTTIINKDKGVIYGLEEGISDLEAFVEYEGGVVEYIETNNGFGTDTVVNFIVDGEIYESYRIVIFGDLNGDGVVDTVDFATLALMVNYEITFPDESAVNIAADLNGDGSVDTLDLSILGAIINFDIEGKQVPDFEI